MSEAEERIRIKAESHLRVMYPGARIIHELKLNDGQTRIDLAAVAAIKSREMSREADETDANSMTNQGGVVL